MLKLSVTSSIGVDRRVAIMDFWACFFRRASVASSARIASSSAWAPARPSEARARAWASRVNRSNKAGWRALIRSAALSIRAAILSRQWDFSVMVRPGMGLLLGWWLRKWISAMCRRCWSGFGGGLELVDQLRGVGDRQLLGAGDAVIAEQAVEVGVLPAGDREDRTDLAGGGGLAGPGSLDLDPRRGPAVAGVDARALLVVEDGRGRARRHHGLGLEPGQLVIDGLLGGDEGIADLLVEAGQVAEQAGLELYLQ